MKAFRCSASFLMKPLWLLSLTVVCMAGCERRPLEEMSNVHYVRVYADEVIKNINTGIYDPSLPVPEYRRPDIFRVGLYDKISGNLVSDRFLRGQGDDALGHYYDGYIVAEPGEYCLMAYSMGTQTTIVADEYVLGKAKVYTNTISPYLRSKLATRADKSELPIRYDPDHLFRARCEDVVIPISNEIDTLKNEEGKPYFIGCSLVQSWYIQIKVRNAHWVSSSVAMLGGISGSKWMYEGEIDRKDETEVYFDMYNAANTKAGEDDIYTQFATFGMFGKIPDSPSELNLTFDFLTTYGARYAVTLDITDEFHEQDAIEHQWLIIDKVITIPDPPENPEEGGMDPGLDDWEDYENDVEI